MELMRITKELINDIVPIKMVDISVPIKLVDISVPISWST